MQDSTSTAFYTSNPSPATLTPDSDTSHMTQPNALWPYSPPSAAYLPFAAQHFAKQFMPNYSKSTQEETDSMNQNHDHQLAEESQEDARSSQEGIRPVFLKLVLSQHKKITVTLSNETVWSKFNQQTTEMIVTKVGRRMFPSLGISVIGLEPSKRYHVYVTLNQISPHCLKYTRGLWVPNGQGEVYPPAKNVCGLSYIHPDSPSTGSHWMKQEISFMKLKLTNKMDNFEGSDKEGSMIFCYSMHKYVPVVHIAEIDSTGRQDGFYTAVMFPVTEFVTVTAYQNPDLTELKIKYNPYAKGVRNQGDRTPFMMHNSSCSPELPQVSSTPVDKVGFAPYMNKDSYAPKEFARQNSRNQRRATVAPYSVPSVNFASQGFEFPYQPYPYFQQSPYSGYYPNPYGYSSYSPLSMPPYSMSKSSEECVSPSTPYNPQDNPLNLQMTPQSSVQQTDSSASIGSFSSPEYQH